MRKFDEIYNEIADDYFEVVGDNGFPSRDRKTSQLCELVAELVYLSLRKDYKLLEFKYLEIKLNREGAGLE